MRVEASTFATRVRTFIIDAITGEEVDSSFRSIALELRQGAAALAALETTPMDIDPSDA